MNELTRVTTLETQSFSFKASINEKIEDVKPEYNFKSTQNTIDDLEFN